MYPVNVLCVFPERAAKIVEQQEREQPRQKQASPRAGTPVGALMGVVPSPSTMGMINQTMTPVSGNPSQRQHECLTARQQGNEAGLLILVETYLCKTTFMKKKKHSCFPLLLLFSYCFWFIVLSLASCLKTHDTA